MYTNTFSCSFIRLKETLEFINENYSGVVFKNFLFLIFPKSHVPTMYKIGNRYIFNVKYTEPSLFMDGTSVEQLVNPNKSFRLIEYNRSIPFEYLPYCILTV